MSEPWDAFVDLALTLGPACEQRSRFADKPALFVSTHEIAHHDGDGRIDPRITGTAWRELREDWRDDPAVTVRPGRRDWIELHVMSAADVTRLAPLISAAVAANQ